MKTLNLNFSTGYLNKLSHIKIGGKTDYLFIAKSVNDIIDLYKYAHNKNFQIIPVGGGSNILFGNANNCIIVPDGYLSKYLEVKGDFIRVSANYNINALIMNLKSKALGGLEFLAAIPAHLGGLIYMNAGAYKKNISQFIQEIKIIDTRGNKITLSANEIDFGYRYSNIKGYIYEATLKLIKKSPAQIEKETMDYITKRMKTQPLTLPNLGSIFKNPKNDFAGRLIEAAGLKGMAIGGVKVYEKHANFIVNTGNATFNDMINLINLIKKTVKKKFSKELHMEIRIV